MKGGEIRENESGKKRRDIDGGCSCANDLGCSVVALEGWSWGMIERDVGVACYRN